MEYYSAFYKEGNSDAGYNLDKAWGCCAKWNSSVVQSCPTLCDARNRSTPGLPVHHQLPESTQTHVHWVGDAIQPSHPLLSPSPPALNLSQHQGLFKWVSSSHQVAKPVTKRKILCNFVIPLIWDINISQIDGDRKENESYQELKGRGKGEMFHGDSFRFAGWKCSGDLFLNNVTLLNCTVKTG